MGRTRHRRLRQISHTLRRPARPAPRRRPSSSARMGNLLNVRHRHARQQMRNGIRLYQQQQAQQAIRQWRAALRQLKSAEDKFITSGYIVQAFCDSGEFEQMLYAAVEQVELANGRQDDFMKSEALLNLARANERLAEFGKAIGYAESSLALPGIDSRSPGYAHLVLALAHMGLANFQSSLQQFEKAMKIANSAGDKLLELQLSIGLGNLFTLIRDLNKALVFLQNALGILQGIEANHVHAKYKSAILYQLSVILCLKGRYTEGREVCEEAMELAKKVGNKPIYARALANMADICREVGETEARETVTKSWARYEQSFRVLRKLKDRMGQVTVLSGMARSAAEYKGVHYAGRCECQAIQLNRKCLELASLIGCKHAMLECHLRLQELYVQLADEENADQCEKAQKSLVREMELFCNFCGQRYGESDESLQALACSHIFHERCLQKIFLSARAGEGPTTCPKCRTRTSLMDHISLSSSNAATPATESIADFISSQPGPSTSTATSLQNPPIPVVLCERNFDDTRWSSLVPPATATTSAVTVTESAERRICLSTSTNSSTAARPLRQRRKAQPQPPTLSTFATKTRTQKENAIPLGEIGPSSRKDEVNEVDRVEEDEDGRGGGRGKEDDDEEEEEERFVHISQPMCSLEGVKLGMTPNHVMAENGGGRKGKQTRLLARGRERMAAISPVAEEEEEEAEDGEDRRRRRDFWEGEEAGRRGVTEL